jgi:GT2 family glycosyltransferase
MSHYQISVIIPTFQRCSSVHRLLQALACQTVQPDQFEVIVSIDGSQDGTLEMVQRFPAPYALRAIWQPNRGRAAACNTGIRASTGDLVIFLDDDMEPVPSFLAAHQQAHVNAPRLGVIGAAPITVEESSPPVVDFIGRKFNNHLERLAQPGYHIQLRDFYSGNFSIRRDTLLEVGLFDEAFRIYGHEDLELYWRLSRAGVKVIYDPRAKARQYFTKDLAALVRDSIAKGKTAILLASKHPEAARHLRLGTFKQVSLPCYICRALLLALSDLFPRTPDMILRLMMRLEQRQPARMQRYYTMALDYYFWWGVRLAAREQSSDSARVVAPPSPSIGRR